MKKLNSILELKIKRPSKVRNQKLESLITENISPIGLMILKLIPIENIILKKFLKRKH